VTIFQEGHAISRHRTC